MADKIKELLIKYKEIIAYLIVGVLTTVVSLGTYWILTNTLLDPANPVQLQAANVLSWIAAVAFAFFTNRSFVFESKGNMGKEAVSFVTARVGTLLLDMGFTFVTVSLLGMNDKVAKLISQVLITIANYVLSKLFVFKKQ